MALARIKGYQFGPIFTPPSMEGTITMPGAPGGTNWGGASVDPETGLLYVKGRSNPGLVKLIKQDPKAPADPSFYGVSEGPYRFAFPVDNLMIAGVISVIKPPYNTLNAIDLNKGDIVWQGL